MLSLMVGTAVLRLAPDDSTVDPTILNERRVTIAASVTVLAGIFQVSAAGASQYCACILHMYTE